MERKGLSGLQVFTNLVPAFNVGHADVESIRDQVKRVSLSNRVAQRVQSVAGTCLIDTDTDRLCQLGIGPDYQLLADAEGVDGCDSIPLGQGAGGYAIVTRNAPQALSGAHYMDLLTTGPTGVLYRCFT